MTLGLKKLVGRLFGDTSSRAISEFQEIVEVINDLNDRKYNASLPDDALKATTEVLRRQLEEGKTLDDVLPEAFAAVREAARRTIGIRHYDVQLIGGMILHDGKIAEMKTGEGKTLAATLPLYLNALKQKGVHLVTVNDYLARRDGGWMGPVFEALGMSVGLVIPRFSGVYDSGYVDPASHLEDERLVHWRPAPRQDAYRADITYGTSNEFGFDYLRDNTTLDLENCVQRPLHYAIIDEVDNILIDEARTPLIISGPSPRRGDKYALFDQIAARLRRNTADEEDPPNGDFDLDEKTRSVTLTERGIDRVEQILRSAKEIKSDEGLYDPQHFELVHFMENALKAHHVFRRDVDYVVTEAREVVLVDSRTGRLMPGRRYSEGLHQAIEAKEKVRVRSETVTIATITIQKYFRLYEKLAGMTGTAATEEEEFRQIYELDVISLPTNVAYRAEYGDLTSYQEPLNAIDDVNFAGVDPRHQKTGVTVYYGRNGDRPYFERADFPDVIYAREDGKLRAVVAEIEAMQAAGRPVLVGTTSIESSEQLHHMLQRANIEHAVLNAKRHTDEALVIAQAGQPGAVTVATSMAGRGTDILLGGNPEGLAARYINEACFDLSRITALVQHVVDGETSEAQSIAARADSLSTETLNWAGDVNQSFVERVEAVDRRGIVPVIVPAVLETFGPVDALPDREQYAQAVRSLVSSVRRGRLRMAREQAREMGLPPEQIDWIVKWIQDLRAYRRQPVQFLAGELFNRHYNARMALVRHALAEQPGAAEAVIEETPDLGPELLQGIRDIQTEWAEKRRQVWALGGLHIIGTERYEARRIDDQFRGRAARQGDPGTSRFYLSLEDELMRRFASDMVAGLMERFSEQGDIPLEARVLSRAVESAQRRIEGYYFDMRKHLVEYDEVVSRQRELIYGERQEILRGDLTDLRDRIRDYFEQEIERIAQQTLADPAAWLRNEIGETIAAYSNLELAESPVNATGVLWRLRGLIPVLDPGNEARGKTPEAERLRDRLAEIEDAEILQEELERLVEQAIADRHHVRIFLGSVKRLVPLQPQVDFVHAGNSRAQWRNVQHRREIEQEGLGFQASTLVNLDSAITVTECETAYRERVTAYLAAMAAEIDAPELRASVEARADDLVNEAFERLRAIATRTPSKQEKDAQLKVVQILLRDGFDDVLIELFHGLASDDAVDSLMGYYDRAVENWERHIAYRAMRGFLNRFHFPATDQEEGRYLRGPVQVDRELSGAVGDLLAEAGDPAARAWIDENWQAAWREVKSAYRPDRMSEHADDSIEAYETAFAGWLAGQTLKTWRAEGAPALDIEEEAFATSLKTSLAEARARLAKLELEEFFRWLVLTRLDREWVMYLEEINDLRQGISLQAYGQRDPQVEFRRQAFDMFDRLREVVQNEIVRWFFRELPNYHSFVQKQREMMRTRDELAARDYRMVKTGKTSSGRSVRGAQDGTSVTLVRDVKLGRNDPCWCGSGKKYKHCHLRSDQAKQRSQS